MTPSRLDSTQLKKVFKTVVYVAISAGIGALIAAIAANPLLFGVVTPVVNVLLVALKQVFTPPEAK